MKVKAQIWYIHMQSPIYFFPIPKKREEQDFLKSRIPAKVQINGPETPRMPMYIQMKCP